MCLIEIIIVADGMEKNVIYNIPVQNSQIINGSCGDGSSDQYITIEWADKNLVSTMDLFFKFYETHVYVLNELLFEINVAIFPNGTKNSLKYLYIGDDFWAPEGWSYHCTKVQSVELSGENRRYIMGTVTLTNIQFEATLTGNIIHFSKPYQCRVDDIESRMYCNVLLKQKYYNITYE